MEWISVEKYLPDCNKNVLVFGEHSASNPQMGGGYISIAKRLDLKGTQLEKESRRFLDKNDFVQMRYVTHWMPLPEKPKAE